ncbi:MAG: hypothetical protein OHK0012_11570 [Synechococcales cyanobacterium]
MQVPWLNYVGVAALTAAVAVPTAMVLRSDHGRHELLDQPALETLGRYSQAAGQGNQMDDGIPGVIVAGDSTLQPPQIVHWATRVVEYAPSPGVQKPWQDPSHALGPISGDPTQVVALGDLDRAQIRQGVAPGSITLEFESGIRNGEGADFAVFENGFFKQNGVFGELAYVEISSDGQHFARFASESLQPTPVAPGDPLDPTAIYNLAGKHTNNLYVNEQGHVEGQSWGTPFDLETLHHHPYVPMGKLDLENVRFVRLVDIPGSGDFSDSQGNPIYDPWPTANGGSGGFDLAGVGVIHPAFPSAVAQR